MGKFRLRGHKRRNHQKVPREERIPLRSIVPNLVTSLAACAGITSICFSSEGRFKEALWALLVACLCDGVDGRIARLLKASSKLGAELDSLADFVNFGVAPAMFMFHWLTGKFIGGTPISTPVIRLVLSSALFYALCDCFRLARFNTMLEQPTLPFWKPFFTGVPAPGGCWMVLTPAIIYECALTDKSDSFAIFLRHPAFGIFMLLFIGLLMASRLPTISLKSIHIKRRFQLPVMAGALLIIAFLVANFWLTLGVVGFIYMFTIPLTGVIFLKLRAKYERENPNFKQTFFQKQTNFQNKETTNETHD